MSRRPLVASAKDKLDEIKTDFANEVGTEFNDGYKGDRSSKVNGYVGGPIGGLMTKQMVEEFEKKLANKQS